MPQESATPDPDAFFGNDPLAAALLEHIDLTADGADRWQARPMPDILRLGSGRVYGGQVVAQVLLAAGASVPDDRPPASFHCRFLRPADDAQPIHYAVARDVDGRSFSHRRIVAEQDGKALMTASMMFHTPEAGVSHQPDMPSLPDPAEALATLLATRDGGGPLAWLAAAFLEHPRGYALLPADLSQWDRREPAQETVGIWLRFGAQLPERPSLHRAMLGYFSDATLLQPADMRHGLSWRRGEVMQSSLDHMIWFHEPDLRADEWLLYVTESPWGGHGRYLCRGSFFDRAGRLVASTTQEALCRLTDKAPAHLRGG
jgi:acyl-CoA thioesterase-2